MFSNLTGVLSHQLAPISDRSNATSNFGITNKGEQDALKESDGFRTSFDIFNRPESFCLDTTDKKDVFKYSQVSKGHSQSVLSMKIDKYEAAVPVVEQATLESRLESRGDDSAAKQVGGIATELVPNVLAQDRREFR